MARLSIVIMSVFLFSPSFLWANDTVRLTVRDSASDIYQKNLIEAALLNSADKFGKYELIVNHVEISSKRSYQELNNGADDIFNIRIGLATNLREKNAIPVPIPIYKGLQSYRLMLVRKGDADRFKNIQDIEDLKAFNIGLLYDWVTTGIMKENGFNITESSTYNGLFRMLAAQRFDYTLLGVNKVYEEMKEKPELFEKLEILPNISLLINSPSYVFVSKKHPNIAKRIEWGFEKMIANGEFDRIINEHYQTSIEEADLSSRKIIKIPNKNLPKSVPVSRKALWLTL